MEEYFLIFLFELFESGLSYYYTIGYLQTNIKRELFDCLILFEYFLDQYSWHCLLGLT